MNYSPMLARLIDALRVLPGVGPKSAQRMAFQLLQRDREGGRRLAAALADAMDQVHHCARCRMLTEAEFCPICAASNRDAHTICVVESPADVMAVEQSASYGGRYFVLMGRLSPLDGIGPDELGLDLFEKLLDDGDVKEVILATNPTVEGEVTANFIAELCRGRGIAASRIAHGVPVGGELEYVDSNTLTHAFVGRQTMDDRS